MAKKIELTVGDEQYEQLKAMFKHDAEQAEREAAIAESDVARVRANLTSLEAQLAAQRNDATKKRAAYRAAFPVAEEPSGDQHGKGNEP